jgi:FAD/FMN-containing dehydrogenase
MLENVPYDKFQEMQLLTPGDDGYEAARKPAIPRFRDARPAAVARCASADDIAAALAYANERGLPAVARSGGHCFAGTSSTSGVVIDVTPLDGVTVDGDVAEIGAGARLGAVYDGLLEHGRTIPAGCGPDVGIAGLVLGGGLGVLGRRHGLSCDSLLGAEVVLRDGTVLECDDEHHADLLWALRGGFGARACVAASFRFATLRPPPLTTFHAAFPPDRMAAVIDAWQAWAPAAPDELAASLVITVPAEVDVPPVVMVFGAMAGGEGDVGDQLAGLGVEPAEMEHAARTHREAKAHLARAGATNGRVAEIADGHAYSRSAFFSRAVPGPALAAALLEDRRPGEVRELDFSPWAGAYTRRPAGATAFVHRDARFLLKQSATVAGGQVSGWLERSAAVVRPHSTGGVYPNFPEAGLEDLGPAYYGTNAPRLQAIARRYDA